METMIKNFKTGFALAILITCVQAYAICNIYIWLCNNGWTSDWLYAIVFCHVFSWLVYVELSRDWICKTYSQPDIYVAYQIKMGVYL